MAAEKEAKLSPAPDHYDGRVAKLEEGVGEMKTDIVENQLKISFLATQVGEGFQRAGKQVEDGLATVTKQIETGLENVTKQIELTLAPIVEKVSEHTASLSAIKTTLTAVEASTKQHDAERTARKERWSALKKFAVAIVTGGAAIGLKELVVFFFRHA